MNPIRMIRTQLGLSQAALGEALGKSQGNIGFYEHGQTVPPEVAKKLIAYAATKDLVVTYEDIYGPAVEREGEAASA